MNNAIKIIVLFSIAITVFTPSAYASNSEINLRLSAVQEKQKVIRAKLNRAKLEKVRRAQKSNAHRNGLAPIQNIPPVKVVIPLPPSRPETLIGATTIVPAQPPPVLREQGDTDCKEHLLQFGIEVTSGVAPANPVNAACTISQPVTLISVADSNKRTTGTPDRRIKFVDRPLLSCVMAERFARFASDVVAPLALRTFSTNLDHISTGSGYECRGRNRVSGAKISSHGQGNAVDVMTMKLADGRMITIAKPENSTTIQFIAELREAACGPFTTVLGPGSDVAHSNHFHLDIEARGKDGRSTYCK